jgi:hypothetical protein
VTEEVLELGAGARCSDGDGGPSGRLRWKQRWPMVLLSGHHC